MRCLFVRRARRHVIISFLRNLTISLFVLWCLFSFFFLALFLLIHCMTFLVSAVSEWVSEYSTQISHFDVWFIYTYHLQKCIILLFSIIFDSFSIFFFSFSQSLFSVRFQKLFSFFLRVKCLISFNWIHKNLITDTEHFHFILIKLIKSILLDVREPVIEKN